MTSIAEKSPEKGQVASLALGTCSGSEPKNIDLGKTQITDRIRVSSAALHREEWHGSWWLVETWIFSDDPAQRNVQVIHGDCSSMDGERPPASSLCDTARRIHAKMAEGLRRKHCPNTAVSHGLSEAKDVAL